METLFIGQQLIRISRTDSTNNHTIELLRQSVIPEGTIVLAEEQAKGRGQRGRTWESEPGTNLTFSMVLYPVFLLPHKQFALNQAVSLAITEVVSDITRREALIKWPNDIYVEEEKISGILIENAIRDEKLVRSVVGIGLNVNQTKFTPDIPNPTSLKLQTDRDHDLEECLGMLCGKLESRYLQLKSKPQVIVEHYLERLYRQGQWTDYKLKGSRCKAKITGISEQGELLLEYKGGRQAAHTFHEVEFIH